MSNSISLRRLRAILRYDPETGIFSWLQSPKNTRIQIGDRAGYTGHRGYRWITADGRQYQEHRLAYFYMSGRWPKQVDHRDGNRSNNSWDNLRRATDSQNQANKRLTSKNSSGYKGVTARKFVSGVRYIAQISHRKRCFHIGIFDTPEMAHAAYCTEARRLHGPFFNGG